MPACPHCARKYCMAHRLPESHGCRDAAKVAAQLQAHQDARDTRAANKAQGNGDARARLEAKKAELAAKRQRKS